MLSVRGEFGYWVFEGGWQAAQRPSWNYRDEDGGGIILDMVCHWRYVLDNLFGDVESVVCIGTTRHPRARSTSRARNTRRPRMIPPTRPSSSRAASIAHINMSWVTRVYRDDLVTFQVDGTHGSAVAGLTDCVIQARQATPRPVWNPDEKQHARFLRRLARSCRTTSSTTTASRSSGKCSSATSVEDAPYKYTLLEGAKGVQLAECALQSWKRAALDRRRRTQGLRSIMNKPVLPMSSLSLKLPDGATVRSRPIARSVARTFPAKLEGTLNRVVLSAAHVVADPLADNDPWLDAAIDWDTDHRVPRACLGPRPRRRRSDGHRAARHGSGLADLAGTDPRAR